MPTRNEMRRAPRSGFVASIIVNAILLYVAHQLIGWRVSWLTPAWSDVLWAVDLTLEVSIVANLLFLAFDANWFRNLAGAVSCAVAVLATWWIYVVFPFDFGSAGNNDLARLVVLLALLAAILATLVTTVVGIIELVRQAMRTPGTAEH